MCIALLGRKRGMSGLQIRMPDRKTGLFQELISFRAWLGLFRKTFLKEREK